MSERFFSLTGASRTSMDGRFRMAGFMLSGSGIRVFVLGNMGLGWGGWGKVQVNDGGGWGCGRDGVWRGTGVVCVLSIGGA